MEMIESGLAGVEIISTAKTRTSRRSNTTATPSNRIQEPQERIKEMYEQSLQEEMEETGPPTEEQEVEQYRKYWEKCFGRRHVSYDAETILGPMYCSTGTIPCDALPESSLQFFSIKVTDLKYDLSWPLQVYGFVAARDSVDRRRNYLFRCTRDSCQTLTEDDPFLRLTGPSRAVLMIDPVAIEVQMKVKTKVESEDQVLAFECFDFHERYPLEDGIRACIPRKRCTLEFAVAVQSMSIEAGVGVRVVSGSWPDGCPGLIACNTEKVKEGRVVLLGFQDGKLHTKSDGGDVELSRRIVSVDYPAGKLIVSVEASRDRFYARDMVDFEIKLSGASTATCDLIFCRMEVTVSWSLLSMYRE
ncbi:unnamed protein product [Alopecurus aequalis]